MTLCVCHAAKVPPRAAGRRAQSRRVALINTALVSILVNARRARAENLRPLSEYVSRLDGCASELESVASELESLTNATPKDYDRIRGLLHRGELGRFWVTARGCDKYTGDVEKSPFAREKADMWSLVPEKSGPLGRALKPDFDNPDDKLCLIYSCVNDPTAPASIDTLYALKLFDEGLRIGAKGERVTAEGLSFVARDVIDKLHAYRALVLDKANGDLLDEAWVNPAPAGWSGVGI